MTSDGSIFGGGALSRRAGCWEDWLRATTPVQTGASGVLWKREDWFAPLGYGGINGAKLRQLVWLVNRYVAGGGSAGVVTGASVLSPQTSMAALVAAHYGLPCRIVLGATRPETAIRHENIRIATEAGATFDYVKVGFNPALQRAVKDLAGGECAGWYRLCYGITTPDDAGDAGVADFHAVGAAQVKNLPASVRTLVMTFGSANSATSVLYGLALHRPPNLERVVLIGIGPTRLAWLQDRLAAIERATGTVIRDLFWPRYHDHLDLEPEHTPAPGRPGPMYVLEHYDLHSTGWAKYADRYPYRYDGIDFHPTYEGKALAFMAERRAEFDWFWNPDPGTVCFWIVGSRPTLDAMRPALGGAR